MGVTYYQKAPPLKVTDLPSAMIAATRLGHHRQKNNYVPKEIIACIDQFYCRAFCFIACSFIIIGSALKCQRRDHLFGTTLRLEKTRNLQFVVCAVCLFLVEAVFISKYTT